MNKKSIQFAHQDDYFRKQEKLWKNSLPKPTDKQLIQYYGKKEVVCLCIYKINELVTDFKRLNRYYSQKIDYIKSRNFKEFPKFFWTLFVDSILGQKLIKITKQLTRLSRLYLLATNNFPQLPKGQLTQDQIQQACQHSINQLYEGKLIRTGRNFKGICPFHEEKHPSFYMYSDTNKFHCYGCGVHGNPIDYLMKINNLSFKEAVKELL